MFRYRTPDAYVDYWRRWYGPTLKAFEAVGTAGEAALRGDLLDLIARFNVATDGTMVVAERVPRGRDHDALTTRPHHGRVDCHPPVLRVQPMPSRAAMAAASVRVDAPSLPRMFETWTPAVFSLMNSVSAIWRLVRPWTSSGRRRARAGQPERIARQRRRVDRCRRTGRSIRPRAARPSIARSSGCAPRRVAIRAASTSASVAA